ncbi:MAG: hypothetical protein ACHQET_01460 [Chitinophagales bacterium]
MLSGLSNFYNYLFYRIQRFYQKIGVGKGAGFYAWLILSLLECLNILSIFYLLILTSSINVQKLGSYKLYFICLICFLLNACYFYLRRNEKKMDSHFGAMTGGKAKRWQVLFSIYTVLTLIVFAVLMVMVSMHLKSIQPKTQNALPFPMR